jgi:hypothetical protein
MAGVCVGLLSICSATFGVGVVLRQNKAIRSRQIALAHSTRRSGAYQRSVVLEQETRKVFPYSIVPGGARTVEEARIAMNRPDVRAIYADVDFSKLREVKLTANLLGYVSYRYDDKIYWTAKKLTLRAGETVFTDGVHMVRGRCLNCYSAIPMAPIRPHEPTEKVLDTPVDIPVFAYKFPILPVETPTLPPPPEELTPTAPILPVVTPGRPGRGIFFPLIPIIPPIHRHHHSPTGGGPPVIPPVIPPVTVVPEPNLAWILAVGLLMMALAYRLRRRSILRLPNASAEKLQPGGTSVVEP